jgi:hypothetical protein
MLFLCIEDIDNQKGLLLQLSPGFPRSAVYLYTEVTGTSLMSWCCMHVFEELNLNSTTNNRFISSRTSQPKVADDFQISNFYSLKTKLLNKITLVIINYIPNGTCINSINERASLFISRYLNTLSEKPPKYVQPSVTPNGVDSADLKLKQTLNAFFHKSRESL